MPLSKRPPPSPEWELPGTLHFSDPESIEDYRCSHWPEQKFFLRSHFYYHSQREHPGIDIWHLKITDWTCPLRDCSPKETFFSKDNLLRHFILKHCPTTEEALESMQQVAVVSPKARTMEHMWVVDALEAKQGELEERIKDARQRHIASAGMVKELKRLQPVTEAVSKYVYDVANPPELDNEET